MLQKVENSSLNFAVEAHLEPIHEHCKTDMDCSLWEKCVDGLCVYPEWDVKKMKIRNK